MANLPAPNPNVPQLPQPFADVGSLAHFARGVKQGMDSLGGSRGRPTDRAVTFNDLVALGLVSPVSVASTGGTTVVVPAGVVAPYVLAGFSGASPLAASQVIVGHRFPILVAFPPNFGPISIAMVSEVGAFVDAAGTPVLNIQRCLSAANPTIGANWSTIGTATFASPHAATLATVGGIEQVFQAGDFGRVVGPVAPDGTLAQIFIALVGKR